MSSQMPFYWMKIYYITTNHVFEVIFNKSMSFVTDKVLKGFDEGLLTRMILIDLQQTFDIIDYEILLQKHKATKFSESNIKWLKSYLSERIFLVNIENRLSNFGKFFVFLFCFCFVSLFFLERGVPQGYILGLLLFLIYVNDML